MLKETEDEFFPVDSLSFENDIRFVEDVPEEIEEEETPAEENPYSIMVSQFEGMNASPIVSQNEQTFFDLFVNADVCFGDLFNRQTMEAVFQETTGSRSRTIIISSLEPDYSGFYDTYRIWSPEYGHITNVYLESRENNRYHEESNVGQRMISRLQGLENISHMLTPDEDDDDFI